MEFYGKRVNGKMHGKGVIKYNNGFNCYGIWNNGVLMSHHYTYSYSNDYDAPYKNTRSRKVF